MSTVVDVFLCCPNAFFCDIVGTPMEDMELVARILAKDKKALYRFYQTYEPKLASYIAHKVANPHDAEEILQDTLFAFLDSIRDFHGESSIKTYVYAICSHKIVDYYRKRKLKQYVFSRVPFLDDLVSPLGTPDEKLEQHLLAVKLSDTFDRLLPQYATVLRAKYELGLSVAEIAKKCAISFKSAESTLFRARRAFVRAFGQV